MGVAPSRNVDLRRASDSPRLERLSDLCEFCYIHQQSILLTEMIFDDVSQRCGLDGWHHVPGRVDWRVDGTGAIYRCPQICGPGSDGLLYVSCELKKTKLDIVVNRSGYLDDFREEARYIL